jgi:hypothetical protein
MTDLEKRALKLTLRSLIEYIVLTGGVLLFIIIFCFIVIKYTTAVIIFTIITLSFLKFYQVYLDILDKLEKQNEKEK